MPCVFQSSSTIFATTKPHEHQGRGGPCTTGHTSGKPVEHKTCMTMLLPPCHHANTYVYKYICIYI